MYHFVCVENKLQGGKNSSKEASKGVVNSNLGSEVGLDQGGSIEMVRISQFHLYVFKVELIVFTESLDVESEVKEERDKDDSSVFDLSSWKDEVALMNVEDYEAGLR